MNQQEAHQTPNASEPPHLNDDEVYSPEAMRRDDAADAERLLALKVMFKIDNHLAGLPQPAPSEPLQLTDDEVAELAFTYYRDVRAAMELPNSERRRQELQRLIAIGDALAARRAARLRQERQAEIEALRQPIQIDPVNAPESFVQLARLLHKRIEQLKVMADVPGAMTEDTRLRVLLASLTEFIDIAKQSRRDLAVEYVANGELSRIEAGRLLNVHQSTIAQWVKEDTDPSIPPVTDIASDSHKDEDENIID